MTFSARKEVLAEPAAHEICIARLLLGAYKCLFLEELIHNRNLHFQLEFVYFTDLLFQRGPFRIR